MYKVNDAVLYGTQGVCRITDISERFINGDLIEYYTLKPVNDEKSTIFIPVQNEITTAKMRSVLSADELNELLKTINHESNIWIENVLDRRVRYKEIITQGSRTELLSLIKTLHQRQKYQKEIGKKLYIADEHFMKDAEKIIYDEFAYVLNIKVEQVLPFIIEQTQSEADGLNGELFSSGEAVSE